VESDESDAIVIAASVADPGCFGTIFDRHATSLHRYLVRRVGPQAAESLVGDVFRIAFQQRHTFDCSRESARPWLYGIATNLAAKHHRGAARQRHALARLTPTPATPDHADDVSHALDARAAWPTVAAALDTLPAVERDTLVLHVWESLSYDEVAAALGIPTGTVRSRLNRARRRLRELVEPIGEPRIETTDPATYTRAKETLMSTVDNTHTPIVVLPTPDIYPRLAYHDELGAVDYLTRVFGFTEQREARQEHDGKYLCWLRIGSGIVMLGHANADVHLIHSPQEVGLTTVIMHVYVADIDAHYAAAVEQGATVTMPIRDAFYGERLYEATDPEGHRWHFAERYDSIRARGGRTPDPEEPC
jgi:RNA polymerase sigma-70 factor (ECF subfamily)